MGNFEKLVVVTVFFLSAIVLAVSLSSGPDEQQQESGATVIGVITNTSTDVRVTMDGHPQSQAVVTYLKDGSPGATLLDRDGQVSFRTEDTEELIVRAELLHPRTGDLIAVSGIHVFKYLPEEIHLSLGEPGIVRAFSNQHSIAAVEPVEARGAYCWEEFFENGEAIFCVPPGDYLCFIWEEGEWRERGTLTVHRGEESFFILEWPN